MKKTSIYNFDAARGEIGWISDCQKRRSAPARKSDGGAMPFIILFFIVGFIVLLLI